VPVVIGLKDKGPIYSLFVVLSSFELDIVKHAQVSIVIYWIQTQFWLNFSEIMMLQKSKSLYIHIIYILVGTTVCITSSRLWIQCHYLR